MSIIVFWFLIATGQISVSDGKKLLSGFSRRELITLLLEGAVEVANFIEVVNAILQHAGKPDKRKWEIEKETRPPFSVNGTCEPPGYKKRRERFWERLCEEFDELGVGD